MPICKIHNIEKVQIYGKSIFVCPQCDYERKKKASKARIVENTKILAQLDGNDKKVAKKGLKSKKKKSTIDKRLDDAWSELVKLKAVMKCEVCGLRSPLNSHHIYSRVKKSLRWKTINGICLCVGHHIGFGFSAHKTPVDFHNWLVKNKGQAFIDNLVIEKNMASHLYEFEKEILLKELQNEIKLLKHGNTTET